MLLLELPWNEIKQMAEVYEYEPGTTVYFSRRKNGPVFRFYSGPASDKDQDVHIINIDKVLNSDIQDLEPNEILSLSQYKYMLIPTDAAGDSYALFWMDYNTKYSIIKFKLLRPQEEHLVKVIDLSRSKTKADS